MGWLGGVGGGGGRLVELLGCCEREKMTYGSVVTRTWVARSCEVYVETNCCVSM